VSNRVPARRDARARRFRRSPHVAVYWLKRRLVVHEYSSDTRVKGSPLILEVIDYLSSWRTTHQLARHLEVSDGASLGALVDSLVRLGVLDASDTPRRPEAVRLEAWDAWSVDAGFFHQATRNVVFNDSGENEARADARGNRPAPPPPVKTIDGSRAALPRPAQRTALARVLTERRTWRRFSKQPVTLQDLSTLLWLTWGIQSWVDLQGYGPTPLTTSPSPGARHSIEAYVLARSVAELPAGLYHYAAADHAIVGLRDRSARRPSDYLPGQGCYDEAGALVFLTAVFERAQYRYPHGRTYRALLAEVGHQAQTFCLVATALGLAPFCSMALADSDVEHDLGIDGISEAVLYAVGVGQRPRGVRWAPYAETTRVPHRTPARPFGNGAGRR
jgi:SagB-type dehydrogenase family enzyme